MNLPPLGIEPRHLWDERRMTLLLAAIKRYQDEEYLVPFEWIREYRELLARHQERYPELYEATSSTPRR